MKLQLALDRMDLHQAIELTRKAEESVDWIEVGTSLIKEFGVRSIRELKQAFSDKIIVADMKTIDNAKYELQICFDAGADVVTVMGVAPTVTIETCMEEAAKRNKTVMIDLLNAGEEQIGRLLQYSEAIFCHHISKDQQEANENQKINYHDSPDSEHLQFAVAGGISIDSLDLIKNAKPSVVIIGSAITKASDPKAAAKKLKETIISMEE